ncbi:Six-hairpin glycosidase [Polyplosphaeria fusca]|uniref:Six-hairpin glycosidase n=1 Tax=Polyplosphaeria fusca TaxID=682080 RepID=A0A9P4V5M2_9PLEO|nr:Six-hairpin glycosidase [Polyplosphaeria fusca]
MKYIRSLLLPLLFVSYAAADYEDDASAAIKTLQNKWYSSSTGLWGDLWWQSGNMVTTIARFGIHDAAFKKTASDIVANTYAKSANLKGASNWKNDYYDDMGWWALGWIAAFDLTGDSKYLNSAKDLFEDMSGGHSTPCGGIWWDKKKTSVTAIANELFLSVAAHLANRVADNEKENYRNWAASEWDWFSKSGMINSNNVINDGLDKGTCKNNGETVFTYNQGVILGGLSELARATSDGGPINAAKKIASGAMSHLTDGGILTEPSSDGKLDEQGAQFKGVFVRNLAALNANAPEKAYSDFLKKNADSVKSKDINGDGVFGPRWQGPGGDANTASHASGVDLLVAVAQAA